MQSAHYHWPILAGNAAIQEQFANRDREALSQMLEQGYKQLKSEHGVVQLQFHTAPAISFLRLHRPEKFGDDLSAIRKTVVEVNASGKPVTGLEYGVEGLGIRGVTPVKKDGKQIGSVEIGMSFGDRFFEAFKRGTGADVALHLATPRGFEAYASTFAAAPALTQEQMTAALTRKSASLAMTVGGVDEAIVLAPVKDYKGDTIGVSMLGVDRSIFVNALSEARRWSIGIGMAVLLLTLGLAAGLSRSIVRPLRELTRGDESLGGWRLFRRAAGARPQR
jgi:methyl-accepting chemotaxis protein